LADKSNGDLLTYGPKPKEGSCNRRSLYLFEKLTIPSKSQSAYPKNSASSGKSSGFGVCMYGTNIGSQLFGAQNQSSSKTETLHSDALIGSKSSAGERSSIFIIQCQLRVWFKYGCLCTTYMLTEQRHWNVSSNTYRFFFPVADGSSIILRLTHVFFFSGLL
jgi:hypothetical protein